MPDLIAQGPSEAQRWRRELPAATTGTQILIGRSQGDWNVPWDEMVSRQHVSLIPRADDRVEVTRLPASRNPVFHGGRQVDHFTLVPGDHFAIGHTTFTLANRPGTSNFPIAGDVTEHAYDLTALRKQNFRDASTRIDMLTRLPDLITGSVTDEELLVRVTGVLLQATPAASAVAIVAVDPPDAERNDPAAGDIQVLHYDSRVPNSTDPPISTRLVRSAVRSRESCLHLWTGGRRDAVVYTASEEVDWAFCVPLRSEACPGWALYVTGQLGRDLALDLGRSLQAAPEDLGDDVKFAELVGTMLANLRQSLRLERRQAAMRRFFAPVVMDALATRDVTEVLAPRETDLAVLFCDLRGFTKQSAEQADRLLDLLDRVSNALGVMTKHILETGGVIGDFHGDSAMGFWGWPLDQHDQALRAATAALRIWHQYAADAAHAGFRCGIGIASGPAVAGRIGTTDQVKVTAFGPVVNLASRLEGISKIFGAEVLLCPATAETLRHTGARSTRTVADDAPPMPFRIRKLATVRPAGLIDPVPISQLLGPPPDSTSLPASSGLSAQQISAQDIANYEAALEAFAGGDWDRAYQLLHALPAWDRPKDVLLSEILRHNRTPPGNWDGIIDLGK